jgi:hypothetical protein
VHSSGRPSLVTRESSERAARLNNLDELILPEMSSRHPRLGLLQRRHQDAVNPCRVPTLESAQPPTIWQPSVIVDDERDRQPLAGTGDHSELEIERQTGEVDDVRPLVPQLPDECGRRQVIRWTVPRLPAMQQPCCLSSERSRIDELVPNTGTSQPSRLASVREDDYLMSNVRERGRQLTQQRPAREHLLGRPDQLGMERRDVTDLHRR